MLQERKILIPRVETCHSEKFLFKIPLVNGPHALISEEDFDFVNQLRWAVNSRMKVYSVDGFEKTTFLGDFLFGNPKKGKVIHLDNDSLDFRRSNLLLVTRTDKIKPVPWVPFSVRNEYRVFRPTELEMIKGIRIEEIDEYKRLKFMKNHIKMLQNALNRQRKTFGNYDLPTSKGT